MVRLLEKISGYNFFINTIPGKLTDFMSRFPRKACEMPEEERKLPYRHQVRRITQGNRGCMRINCVLVDMARDGRKDEKYQKCIEAIKLGRSPKGG